jgi:hypothetical protein
MKNKHSVIFEDYLQLLVLTFNRNKLYLQLQRAGSGSPRRDTPPQPPQLSVQGAVDRRKPDNVLITCLSLAADWGRLEGEGFTVTADTKKKKKKKCGCWRFSLVLCNS